MRLGLTCVLPWIIVLISEWRMGWNQPNIDSMERRGANPWKKKNARMMKIFMEMGLGGCGGTTIKSGKKGVSIEMWSKEKRWFVGRLNTKRGHRGLWKGGESLSYMIADCLCLCGHMDSPALHKRRHPSESMHLSSLFPCVKPSLWPNQTATFISHYPTTHPVGGRGELG